MHLIIYSELMIEGSGILASNTLHILLFKKLFKLNSAMQYFQ